MMEVGKTFDASMVTPLAGVWIEIGLSPMSARRITVTPLAGVWIEMPRGSQKMQGCSVTPLAGVWIEISAGLQHRLQGASPPSRGCGSKSRHLLL